MKYYRLFNEIGNKWDSSHSYKAMMRFMDYACRNTRFMSSGVVDTDVIRYTLNAMITLMKIFDCDIKLYKQLFDYLNRHLDIMRKFFDPENEIIQEEQVVYFYMYIIPKDILINNDIRSVMVKNMI